MERPSATFRSGKCTVLNDFSYVEALSYDTLENKSSKTCEYQPDAGAQPETFQGRGGFVE